MVRRTKWLSLLLVFSIMFLAVAPQATLASTGSGSSHSNGSQAWLNELTYDPVIL
ncbi:hypothetical protein SDC9_135055 [bioreactor metagenome]|uniref:Uncharacterized protein n=1 Tax=bioreactor metagenome TaxID=1076179 RepID=A0A645DES5_9ZZZZ